MFHSWRMAGVRPKRRDVAPPQTSQAPTYTERSEGNLVGQHCFENEAKGHQGSTEAVLMCNMMCRQVARQARDLFGQVPC